MPVIKSAIKKLRADKKKTLGNDMYRNLLESAFRNAVKSKKKEDIIASISLIDKSARKFVIHKNKAARMKSQLSRFLPAVKAVKTTPTTKAAPRKTAVKAA